MPAGFKQVYGNFDTDVVDYQSRKKRASLLGGAPSAWFATNEVGFGKELMGTFLGCSSILWNGSVANAGELSASVQSRIPSIRERLRGFRPPSQTETSILPLEIASQFNADDDLLRASVFRNGTRVLRTRRRAWVV